MKEYKTQSIKNWSVEDRPREKLLKHGIHSLSNTELLAILIGSGTREGNALELARNILASVDYDLSELTKLSTDDLMKHKGIGEARAVTLVAALELGSRKNHGGRTVKTAIKNSQSAFEVLYPHLGELEHEEFWILILNRGHKVLKAQKISQGGLTGTVIDTRMILKHAIDKKACSIIIAHNHPSGNTSPSEADINITKKISEAAKLMDITLLDHLVLTRDGFFSFADEGLV